MNSLKIAETYGFLPYRRRSKPHLSIRFDGIDFHIDSSPGVGWNLITHAHSDHYGVRNMRNRFAIASNETARILEAVAGEKFAGIKFNIGETLNLSGLKVKTYPTHHIHGAVAFMIKDILITGDVKDWRNLPKCSVLITEATYAHPSYVFDDEIDKLIAAAEEGAVLGAYPIGKAQRVVEILSNAGLDFRVDRKIEKICKALNLKVGSSGTLIVPPRKLSRYGGYILTAQRFYRWPRITLSDHVDYRGILRMIEHCKAEHVIFYHGNPSKALKSELAEMGVTCSSLRDIDVYL